MKPILYDEHETAFDTNGLGVLVDAIDCTVTQELNGIYELALKYPLTGIHYGEIAQRSIILATVDPVSDPQPFRVYRFGRTIGGVATVYARHIAYDNMGTVCAPFGAESLGQALTAMKNAATTECLFDFETDKNVGTAFTNAYPKTIWATLGGTEGSLLDRYGGEYEFDRFTIRLLNRRGADRGVSIRYGKNLTSLEQDENIANTFTGVYPYWLGQDGTLVQLSEKILHAEGDFSHTRIMALDLTERWDAAPTEDQLRAGANTYMSANEIGKPKVSVTVNFVQLEQTEEYKHLAILERVLLGDTVHVLFAKLGVDATARAVKIVWDALRSRYTSISIGSVRSNIADTAAAQQQEIQKRPTLTVAEKIAKHLAQAITGARGGAARLLDTDGDEMPDEIYVADNPDPDQAKIVWRWNYMGWGVSRSGYNGPFEMGATLEDGILAHSITAAHLKAGYITSEDGETFYLDLDNGILRIKSLTELGTALDETKIELSSSIEKTANAIRTEVTQAYKEYTDQSLNGYAEIVTAELAELQAQIDGTITSHFYDYDPTLDNLPASEWTTEEEKRKHSNDTFTNTVTGRSWRWSLRGTQDSTTWQWVLIEDTDVTKALADAARAQDTADSKRRVFVVQPAPPYDVGDLWVDGTDLRTCVMARESGDYDATDWEIRVDYANGEETATTFEQMSDRITAEAQAQTTRGDELEQQIAAVTLRADGLSANFESVQQNGVDQVHTKTGIDLDATGISIQREGDPVTSNLNHHGLEVDRYGEPVLVANDQGVEATDLTARNYLRVGYIRFEAYGRGRTALFYNAGGT